MATVDKSGELSDNQLMEIIHKNIIDKFGINAYVRYIRMIYLNTSGEDYLKEQEDIFSGMTIDQINDAAKKYYTETSS